MTDHLEILSDQAARLISTSQLHVTMFTHLAYQRGRLPRAFRVLRPSDVILGGAWRLDAFSAYRFRSQLPGATLDRITGILEERCSRSSRTKEQIPHVCCAHSG